MSRLNDDWFDRQFDRHEKRMDDMLDRPGRTFLKFGLVALVVNLIFWAAVIAMIVFAVSLFL